MSAISINNLHHRSGRLSLNIDELNISEGMRTGIYAPKRGGKSTLMSFIAGFSLPDKGTVRIFDGTISDNADIRSSTAYINPYIGFVPTLRITQVIKSFKSFYDNFDEDLLDELLTGFSISKTAKLITLNKIQSLKLSFALGTAHHPRLMLIDDLSADADPFVISAIMGLITPKLDGDVTIVFTTSRMGDLEKYADNAVILLDGKVKYHVNLNDYADNCYILSGKCDVRYDNAIGYHVSDGACNFMVYGESAMKKLTSENPALIAGKAAKGDVISYLIKGDSDHE